MCAVVACWYRLFGDVNGVGIVEVDLCFIIHRSVSGIGKLAATEKHLSKGWDNVDNVGRSSYFMQKFCYFGGLGRAACG